MKTARVVVIDEDPKEATTLLQALGMLGIGAIYISGDDRTLMPRKPLRGIRLVFLDIDLLGRGESRQTVPYTANVLRTCVELVPRTTGIICWTKHEEEVELLREELKTLGITPAFVKQVANKQSIVESMALADLEKDLQAKVNEEPGRCLLHSWEQTAHEAATDSTAALMEMSADDDDLLKLLATISVATAEGEFSESYGAVAALHQGLTALHADSVYSLTNENNPEVENAFNKCLADRQDSIDVMRKSQLNSILLTSSVNDLRPGNVYRSQNGFSSDLEGAALRAFVRELFPFPGYSAGNDKKAVQKNYKSHIQCVSNRAQPIFVEFTPACDHINRKVPNARFLAGILVVLTNEPSLTEQNTQVPPSARMYAKHLEPMALQIGNQDPEIVRIILNARHLVSLPIEDARKLSPIFRLRSPVVSDIQAWFASHAARPGYVSIR